MAAQARCRRGAAGRLGPDERDRAAGCAALQGPGPDRRHGDRLHRGDRCSGGACPARARRRRAMDRQWHVRVRDCPAGGKFRCLFRGGRGARAHRKRCALRGTQRGGALFGRLDHAGRLPSCPLGGAVRRARLPRLAVRSALSRPVGAHRTSPGTGGIAGRAHGAPFPKRLAAALRGCGHYLCADQRLCGGGCFAGLCRRASCGDGPAPGRRRSDPSLHAPARSW